MVRAVCMIAILLGSLIVHTHSTASRIGVTARTQFPNSSEARGEVQPPAACNHSGEANPP
jgi:hypothetical protein